MLRTLTFSYRFSGSVLTTATKVSHVTCWTIDWQVLQSGWGSAEFTHWLGRTTLSHPAAGLASAVLNFWFILAGMWFLYHRVILVCQEGKPGNNHRLGRPVAVVSDPYCSMW